MNVLPLHATRLRRLAAAEVGPAPYDFAEFQRRAAAAPADGMGSRVSSAQSAGAAVVRRPGWRNAAASSRGAALAASVTALLLGVVLWQRFAISPALDVAEPVAVQAIDADTQDAGPALVRVDSLAARSELEDRIAYFDAVLSESRVSGAAPARLAALEQGRSQMVDSLRRVHYAEQLIIP